MVTQINAQAVVNDSLLKALGLNLDDPQMRQHFQTFIAEFLRVGLPVEVTDVTVEIVRNDGTDESAQVTVTHPRADRARQLHDEDIAAHLFTEPHAGYTYFDTKVLSFNDHAVAYYEAVALDLKLSDASDLRQHQQVLDELRIEAESYDKDPELRAQMRVTSSEDYAKYGVPDAPYNVGDPISPARRVYLDKLAREGRFS